jgi:hypothetical protein
VLIRESSGKNNYFISNDPKKIIEFYESFDDRDELIEWIKERPKGNCEIREVNGEKDIIVVIPTTDFDGEYARNCREEIFKGLHIVFVVSGKNNYYFNHAHNCSVGTKKALEYNPKWIIVSNDDMYKIDDVNLLIRKLNDVDENEYDIVFIEPSKYHSVPSSLGKERLTKKILFYLNRGRRNQLMLERKFEIEIFPWRLKGIRKFFLGKAMNSFLRMTLVSFHLVGLR